MTAIYRLSVQGKQLRPMDPLHVGNFYHKTRLHRSSMQDRQDLILYLAQLHRHATASARPRAFSSIKLRLTTLRDWVYDYRIALDHFFDVKQLGYNISDDVNEVSVLVPKDLGMHNFVQTSTLRLEYTPPSRPDNGTISKVYVQSFKLKEVIDQLARDGRHDLIEPVRWLATQSELNFIFQPAGRLQQRDTSVWPVAAVETWPSWLRETLFGPGIDIDSAYTQFVMQHLRIAYSGREHLLDTLYPDLVQLCTDKQTWRRTLCEDVLHLEWTPDNASLIKTICMSLANGSRISPSILSSSSHYSLTADIIIKQVQDVSIAHLDVIGNRLQHISRQYATARKMVCNHWLRLNPTRENQKKVFSSYFEWERRARYLIWESIDRHGIMVHDGIDGVPAEYISRLPDIMNEIGIQVTA